MEKLWKIVNTSKRSIEVNISIFLVLNTVIYGFVGFEIWLVVQNFALDSVWWTLCFVGYTGFMMGYLRGVLFLYKTDI